MPPRGRGKPVIISDPVDKKKKRKIPQKASVGLKGRVAKKKPKRKGGLARAYNRRPY